MAKNPNPDPAASDLNEVATKVNDPGGAHMKGYTAEPGPDPDVPAEGPIPLAPSHGGTIRQPEKDDGLTPTGRSEPGDYTPNDRLMGSDR
jgi:hypothetical protein